MGNRVMTYVGWYYIYLGLSQLTSPYSL